MRSVVQTLWRMTVFLALFGALSGALGQTTITLTHVHGLSFSADGKRLVIPSHHGLAVYEDGKWSKAPGPQHDYMGFSGTKNRLYSSGHPAPGTGLVNPFGLIRSQDGGKTWDKLGLEGESDFHLLATSWNTNAVYVWNSAPNSRMKAKGLYFTLTDGLAWRAAAAAGLVGDPQALAVHPDNAAMIAVATSTGAFLSKDNGARFQPLASGVQGLSLHFDLDGKHLWFGSFDGTPHLVRIELGSAKSQIFSLPPLTKDAIAYIAQSPANMNEYAIATFARSVYLSRDAARNWTQIADRGKGK